MAVDSRDRNFSVVTCFRLWMGIMQRFRDHVCIGYPSASCAIFAVVMSYACDLSNTLKLFLLTIDCTEINVSLIFDASTAVVLNVISTVGIFNCPK